MLLTRTRRTTRGDNLPNQGLNHVFALRMQALIDQMQGKVKSYKKQIEEAEEIAALNLAKFRQTQNSLGSAEERAEAGEAALAKNRLRARSASLGPVDNLSHFK